MSELSVMPLNGSYSELRNSWESEGYDRQNME